MPKAVKGTTEEREQFMFDVFKRFYSDPANAGKDLSVAKANAEHIKKFGSMLRNKKAYEIRDSVKAQLRNGAGNHTAARKVTSAARGDATVNAQDFRPAALITGNAEQLNWLQKEVLPQLWAAGAGNWQVDHTTDAYAVVARSSRS